jgi:cytochrome c553
MPVLMLVVASILAVQGTPPGQWDPTSPEDVARRQAQGGSQTSGDPLKGPDVPDSAQDSGRGQRGAGSQAGGAMNMSASSVEGILQANCAKCHGVDKQKAGLQIVPISRLHEGPEKFRVIKPGDPVGSLLLQRIKLPGGHDDVMPPDGKTLTAKEIEAIEAWIKSGGTPAQAQQTIAGMSSGAQGRQRATTARVFLRAYMDLKDLTPEQRKAGIDAAVQARNSLSAEDKAAMREYQQWRSLRAQGKEIPPELVKRRQEIISKAEALKAAAQKVQNELWALLKPAQQETVRTALAAAKTRPQGRPGRRPGQ